MIDHRTAPYAALVLRLSLSFLFIAHLYRKLAVIGFDSWWSGLAKQGYADWMLSYTLTIEFGGAILLLLGIYTRYVSILALPAPFIGISSNGTRPDSFRHYCKHA